MNDYIFIKKNSHSIGFLFLSYKQELDKYGIAKVMEMAMNDVDPDGKRGYHISFDIDALDRFEAPSTGTRSKFRLKKQPTHCNPFLKILLA